MSEINNNNTEKDPVVGEDALNEMKAVFIELFHSNRFINFLCTRHLLCGIGNTMGDDGVELTTEEYNKELNYDITWFWGVYLRSVGIKEIYEPSTYLLNEVKTKYVEQALPF